MFLSSYVLYNMLYECEEHKVWLINKTKCWILIALFKKMPFAKLNSHEIKKVSRKAWVAKFFPAKFSDNKVAHFSITTFILKVILFLTGFPLTCKKPFRETGFLILACIPIKFGDCSRLEINSTKFSNLTWSNKNMYDMFNWHVRMVVFNFHMYFHHV